MRISIPGKVFSTWRHIGPLTRGGRVYSPQFLALLSTDALFGYRYGRVNAQDAPGPEVRDFNGFLNR